MIAALVVALAVGVPAEFQQWKIAYVQGANLYLARGDGSHRRLLARNAHSPCWWTDDRSVAFSRGREVLVERTDGTGAFLLGRVPAGLDVDAISWGKQVEDPAGGNPAEGKLVALVSASDSTGAKIFIAPLRKGGTALAKPFSVHDIGPSDFEFSHYDYAALARFGRLLAFTVNGDIWLRSWVPVEDGFRSGWDEGRVLPVAEYDGATYRADKEIHTAKHISWAPDARSFAYELSRDGGSGCEEVWLAALSWSGRDTFPTVRKRLLSASALDPCFSPDGKWVFVREVGSHDGWYGLSALSLQDGRKVRLIPDASPAVVGVTH